MINKKIALIPAYKPDNTLINLVELLSKEDIDTIISESISSKQFLAKLKQLGYQYYIKYNYNRW